MGDGEARTGKNTNNKMNALEFEKFSNDLAVLAENSEESTKIMG